MLNNHSQPVCRRRSARWWILGGVLLGLACAVALRAWPTSSPPTYSSNRVKAWQKVEARLKDADTSEAQIVERQLAAVRDFFNERKQGAAAFADRALSLGGKWAWLKGKIAADNGENHRVFLREAFEEHLFRGEDLRAVINAAVAGMLSELAGNQNLLLAQIRADLSDADLALTGSVPALQSDEVFVRAYEEAVKSVVSVMAKELGVAISREVVAWVAADIAAKVITRLGVSAGILGAGAASGVATLGVGFGAALLVDSALDWVLRRVGHDPVGAVARKVEESLDQTREFLIEGSPASGERAGQPGLWQELTKLCQGQASVRREALRRLILLEGGLQ